MYDGIPVITDDFVSDAQVQGAAGTCSSIYAVGFATQPTPNTNRARTVVRFPEQKRTQSARGETPMDGPVGTTTLAAD